MTSRILKTITAISAICLFITWTSCSFKIWKSDLNLSSQNDKYMNRLGYEIRNVTTLAPHTSALSHDIQSSRDVQTRFSDINENNLKIMRQRADDIKQRCNHVQKTSSVAGKQYARFRDVNNTRAFYRATDIPFIYVPTLKCGYSTWMDIFFAAGNQHQLLLDSLAKGITDEHLPVDKVGLKFIHSTSAVNEIDAERILVVRNPYHRLISGYKYRILGPNGTMCKGVPKMSTNGPDDFPKFTECLLYKARTFGKLIGSYDAQYRLDPHFLSQAHQSSSCFVNYTLVVHMESFESEVETLIRHFKLNTTVVKANISKSVKKKDTDYLKELNKRQLEGLREFLSVDFDVFGFDPYLPGI